MRQGCARKRAKLEMEQAANVELIQSIAELTRARAEDLLELEGLRSKLRSLEVSEHSRDTIVLCASVAFTLTLHDLLYFTFGPVSF